MAVSNSTLGGENNLFIYFDKSTRKERGIMEEKKKKVCEFCGEQPATVLCAECWKCYCGECSKLVHGIKSKKGHKTEGIPEGVVVNAMCPIHSDSPLKMFCVDEGKLCCFLCEKEKLHQGHKLVKVSDIAQDNGVFSASKVRKDFAEVMKKDDELVEKIRGIIERIRKEGEEAKKKVGQTFKEEHEKLKVEEDKIMRGLEKTVNGCEETLQKLLADKEGMREYGKLLGEAGGKGGGMSRLMEVSLASEMEKQREEMEEFLKTEMTELKFNWNSKDRKLMFTSTLFNGAPVPTNVKITNVTWQEINISWECDVSRIVEKDQAKVVYVVEMKNGKKGKWKEVYSGKDKKCSVRDLYMDTEYSFHVKCTGGEGINGNWSEIVSRRTERLPPPSNVRVKIAGMDSITFAWDAVEGASSYQIEVDRNLFPSSENTFMKGGLLPDIEYSFRVRAVKGNSVGEWSGAVKGRTLKAPTEWIWKKCPDNVDAKRIYSVDGKNPRIVTKCGDEDTYCTIPGNTSLPLDKVTSWSIKILKSKSDGSGVFIGVAPSDINQNEEDLIYKKCGWYFNCYSSKLWSGPPQSFDGKEYGPRKEKAGEYFHTGDTINAVIDTTKGEFSFVLNGVNHGVAFEGIPLDKPIVPCVLLYHKGDSVEIII